MAEESTYLDIENITEIINDSIHQEAKTKLELKIAKEEYKISLYDNIFKEISKVVGFTVNKDNFHLVNLENKTFDEIIDLALGEKDLLIKGSNKRAPYSLIKNNEELEKYIPNQIATTNITRSLELLSERSAARATEIIKEYNSENTSRAHYGDLIYWQAWLSAVGFDFYQPISMKEIITFIIQHTEDMDPIVDQKLVNQGYKSKLGPHKLSTVKRRLASLSVFLDLNKLPNECRSDEIKSLLTKLTKKYGSSKPAGKAITKDILDDMINTCGSKLIDIRDKAVLLFAWSSGGRRRSEVSSADIKNLIKSCDNNYLYTIPQSKTDQEKKGRTVPIKGRAAVALSEWLVESGITEGPIFRSVKKGCHLGGALSDIDIYRIVKNRLKKAGYDESHFGAHSLRSGFVTEAGKRQKPVGDVMAMTTHRSVSTLMKYYQAGNVINNSAADLAD